MPNNRWALIISLCMVALAGLGFYSLEWNTLIQNNAENIILLSVIGIVGLYYFFDAITTQPDNTRTAKFNLYLEMYAEAWRKLRQTRWMHNLFGGIAAICVASSLISGAWGITLLRKVYNTSLWVNKFPPVQGWLKYLVSNSLTGAFRSVFAMFYPHTGIYYTSLAGAIFAICVLVSIIWINRRLTVLSQESEDYSVSAPYARRWVNAFGFVAFIYIAIMPLQYYLSWNAAVMSKALAPLTPAASAISSIFGLRSQVYGQHQPAIYPMLFAFLCSVIANSALIGGLLGSLKRMRDGGAVTVDSFFNDAVRYFKPLSFVYVVIEMVVFGLPLLVEMTVHRGNVLYPIYISFLPLAAAFASTLLMLAPLWVVEREQTPSQAISSSMKNWKSHFWQLFTFIGLGCFILYIPHGIWLNSLFILGSASYWRVLTDSIYVAISVLLQGVVILALWEFYVRVISGNTADAVVSE